MNQQTENCSSSCCSASPVVIIGSGSAAFAAATQLAKGGRAVKIIESLPKIGGTCVNVGCVPSKILIQAAKFAHESVQTAFPGIQTAPSLVLRDQVSH